MKKIYISKSQEETWEIARKVLDSLGDTNVIALQGELGAGKTTFSQGLLQAAGAEGPFTSPTFVIMKKYDLKVNGKQKTVNRIRTIYHLDCYRVDSKDVMDLGWEEIINNPQNLVLVEWPEKIEEILPKKIARAQFSIKGQQEREITLSL